MDSILKRSASPSKSEEPVAHFRFNAKVGKFMPTHCLMGGKALTVLWRYIVEIR
jgi:hypothetical protein